MKRNYGMLLAFLIIPLPLMASSELPESASFEQIDRDNSGSISKAEALRRSDLARYWDDIDTDKDGAINLKEFTAYESEGRYMPPEDSQEPELGAAPMR